MKKYFTIILLVFLAISGRPSDAQISGNKDQLTPSERQARDVFRQLTDIRTTLGIGCTLASRAMAERFKEAGFPESDVILAGPQPQHLNLIVRYRSKGSRPPVLFIGHLDVVEALKEDWTVDPFKFIEKDGYFYGRGTSDMKNDDAILVATLIRLKSEGYIPDRDIILALTDDEEGGDANGVDWLLKNRRELIDAEYCINPDGGGGDIKNGRNAVMNIQTGEKIYLDYTLEAHNKGGHSSLPEKTNAIYQVAEALVRLEKYEFPVRLNETTRAYFERNAVNETGRLKSDMLAVSGSSTDMAAADRLASISPFYNSMMRTTCVATTIKGGHALNALPQTVTANINCRMLPDDTPENVVNTLKSVINDPEITIINIDRSVLSPASPLREDILETLDTITASMWPGAIVTPVMITGATDGRYLRKEGIPVYGISGVFSDFDDVRAHGRDERIGVKEFYKGLEFMYRFMKSLTSDMAKH
jgi:acetylornithine deacetylase/succinyl-diaminopimelate desuccinylase-like protein